VTIKTHHNVGGLRPDLPWKLIEPRASCSKDEGRQVGAELGLPEENVGRHPFPGRARDPRLGPVTEERLDLSGVGCDHIEEIRTAGLDDRSGRRSAVLHADQIRGRDGRRPHL